MTHAVLRSGGLAGCHATAQAYFSKRKIGKDHFLQFFGLGKHFILLNGGWIVGMVGKIEGIVGKSCWDQSFQLISGGFEGGRCFETPWQRRDQGGGALWLAWVVSPLANSPPDLPRN